MSAVSPPLPAPFRWENEQVTIDLPGARAVFTTRRGGHSRGPYESLNLGRLTDDDGEAVQANLRGLQEAYGVRLVWGRQLHGSRVVVHDGRGAAQAGDGGQAEGGGQPGGAALPEPVPSPEEGDGRIATSVGLAPMVLTADCLSVIVSGAGGVAALHAGWRGLLAGVIEEGVSGLRERGVTGELEAAIGPHARACCYEVGGEVHEAFTRAGYAEARAGRHLDMTRVATRQLQAAGVGRVHDLGLCTMCSHPSLFFSHRRDRGVTGRQAGLAWLT